MLSARIGRILLPVEENSRSEQQPAAQEAASGIAAQNQEHA